MPPILALILCLGLVIVLLYIERRHDETSLALWIPTLWVLISASRPLGRWYRFDLPHVSVETGSPVDRWVLTILIVLALFILFRRKTEWSRIIKDNFWVILLFGYMGVSILWSDITFVSFKRWFRSTADIFMAVVVLSERNPLASLERILRRCAYVLIPFSLVLVKYFPQFGRAYTPWSGDEWWTGVTTTKNSLGVLCAMSAFILIWALCREWRSGKLFENGYQTFADTLVLGIALYLLIGSSSHSATSIGIFIAAIATLLLIYPRENLARYVARHLKIWLGSSVLIFFVFYESVVTFIAPVFGRDETLTGRVDIWRPVLDFASRSPIFGVGYGGFWAPGNTRLEEIFSPLFILANAHNGYLAVYLELGILGLTVLGAFILAYCGIVRRKIETSLEWGVFGICLLLMLVIRNYTEVGFLSSADYLWSITVFSSIVFSEAPLHAKME